MLTQPQRAFLLILDGWGIGAVPEADAIRAAHTPFVDQLLTQYPHSTLATHGEDVGLPEGQMGNSEVGHLNIGAGRVVWQELARINKAIREGEMAQNPALLEAINYAIVHDKALHLLGLLSDGGVHSHIEHLKNLCDIAAARGCKRVFVHAFTDGRDCDPKSGAGFVADLLRHIEGSPVRLASVIGRYYAMDRDQRWERVSKAYQALVNAQGTGVSDMRWEEAFRNCYEQNITDEFLPPLIALDGQGRPEGRIQANDAVICFNFRTDRLRELTQALTQSDFAEYGMQALPLHYMTMTRYDETFRNVRVMFEKDDVSNTLGETLERAGKTQLRIAETEKYPHVTFFFSGGREKPFEGERRILIPSPKVATYDLQPEMSAPEITDAALAEISATPPDFICLNFANADMVGHTGVFDAAVKAAETVDACLARLVPAALAQGYACLIIADHGNSDYLINPDGSPNTAHTKNPVPCILVGAPYVQALRSGRLADVAPSLLDIMGIEAPVEMTGQSLIVR